jgi:Glycosyltransferase family 87
MLACVTGFRVEQMTLLAFVGFGSLYSNFLLGQYYVFLLFLLTAAFYLLAQGKATASGFVSGLAFGLKLYGGPLLLYFLIRKNWKAVAGFGAAVACSAAVAIAVFGWGDVRYYVSQILPRALEGEIIDPYNSGNGTFATLLRGIFVAEPELNPQPVWNAPLAFFLLQPFFRLMILALTLLGLAEKPEENERRGFAWFLLAILLLSANTASYTFLLALLPIALLLVDTRTPERVFLIVTLFALCFPLRPGWTEVFSKLWVLVGIFIFVGRPYWRAIRPRMMLGAAGLAALVACASARRHAVSHAAEPGQRYERVAVQKDAIFSGAPAVSASGWFYQSIADDRYVLRWLHEGTIEELRFEGHAFNLLAPDPSGPIYFELVAHGTSTEMAFDPATRRSTPSILPAGVSRGAADSVRTEGAKQVWLRNAATGQEERLTGGNCNSAAPAWELDSSAIIFASDCGRGIGLPALYCARIANKVD